MHALRHTPFTPLHARTLEGPTFQIRDSQPGTEIGSRSCKRLLTSTLGAAAGCSVSIL